MESISPLIEPCTLHFGLLNEKEKKRETKQNPPLCFWKLVSFFVSLSSPPLSRPKRQWWMEPTTKGSRQAHRAWCCFCQGSSKGRQHHTARPPFLPKQMLFLLKWWQSDLITGRKGKGTSILLGGEVRLEALGRMGTRIHQSPGPLLDDAVCLSFPICQNRTQAFLAISGGCGRSTLYNLIWGQKVGKEGMRQGKDYEG